MAQLHAPPCLSILRREGELLANISYNLAQIGLIFMSQCSYLVRVAANKGSLDIELVQDEAFAFANDAFVTTFPRSTGGLTDNAQHVKDKDTKWVVKETEQDNTT